MTPEARLVAEIAQESTARICRRVIMDLQQVTDTLSGDDSGLINLWDEICVQRQGEDSFYWAVYDEMVRDFVAERLEKVPSTELQAIWLQTGQGEDWLIDDERSPEIPWTYEDVTEYIVREVYNLAGDWSNRRIRDFLAKDWCDDF